MKRTHKELMERILDCYGALSPENLSCDGEASESYIRRTRLGLELELEAYFNELGKRVSEEEAYNYAASVHPLS